MELEQSVRDQLEELTKADENIVGFSGEYVGDDAAPRAVIVYVAEATEAVPAALDTGVRTVPVEVMVVGNVVPQSVAPEQVEVDPKKKTRPLIGGISVSSESTKPDAMTGTLGYFVKQKDGKVGLLTCAHILRKDDKLALQPGRVDGGTDSDKVGGVTKSIEDSTMDAAYALLDTAVKAEINDIGTPTGTSTVKKGDKAKKSGRTTGVTHGTVGDVSAFIQVGGPDEPLATLIRIDGTDISKGGDSGAIWLDAKDGAFGLHFAGNDPYYTIAWAYPIENVLIRLDVEFGA